MPTEIIEKPWGYEEIWAKTENYVGKKIFIKKGRRLSKQYHKEKEGTIYVIEGNLRLQFEERAQIMILGESYHIPPGTIHGFCADRNNVVLIEVSSPELSDIVCLDDDYIRD